MSAEDPVINTQENQSVTNEEHKDDVEQPEEMKEEELNDEPTTEENNVTKNEEKTDNEEKVNEEQKDDVIEENKEESKEDDLQIDTTENNNQNNENSAMQTASTTKTPKSPKSHTTHSVTTYLDPEAPLPSHLPQKNSPENKEKLASYSYNPNDTGITERPSCFNDLESPEKPYKSNEKHKTIAELLNPNPPQKVSVKTIMKEQRKNIDKIYQTKLEFAGQTSPRAKGNNNKKGGAKKTTKSKSPRRVNNNAK